MLYYICRLNDDGQWEGLRSTHDEEYSDQLVDFYCAKWPNAYIDVLTYDEYHGGPVKWQVMAIGA
jgi:hypothetical protein